MDRTRRLVNRSDEIVDRSRNADRKRICADSPPSLILASSPPSIPETWSFNRACSVGRLHVSTHPLSHNVC